MNKPELLAPAGSMECLRAAVDNGADAVYLGIGINNARSRAENFSLENIRQAILYCHCYGVRTYLAANTLLKDDEISYVIQIIDRAYEAGIDAVIVQDIGLLSVIRDKWPDLPIHASTQMNLFYAEAMINTGEAGISRIVLPRELSLKEIELRQSFGQRSGIETEVFIHGAHCVSYSGVCLFSAMNASGTRSGNRGDCAQPCRSQYSLSSLSSRKLRSGHLLSIKDRTSVPVLEELMKLNINSLKIEGRMRDPSYVAVTVRAYRLLIDAIMENRCDDLLKQKTTDALLQVYNRGGSFSSSYYSVGSRGDLYSGEYTSRFGVFSGRIVKTNSKSGFLTLFIESNKIPGVGDYLSVRDNEVEVASFPVGRIEKNNEYLNVYGLHPHSIEMLTQGLKVYITQRKYPLALLDEFTRNKTIIDFSLRISEDKDDEIIVEVCAPDLLGQNIFASNSFKLPEQYAGSFIQNDRIIEQMNKTKDSPFTVRSVSIYESLKICAPVSFINYVRRDMIERLENAVFTSKFRSKPIIMSATPNTPVNRLFSNALSEKSNQVAVDYIDLRQFNGSLAHGADLYHISVYDLLNADSISKIRMLLVEEPQSKLLIRYPDAYSDKEAQLFDSGLLDFSRKHPDCIAGTITSGIYAREDSGVLSSSANIMNSKAVIEAFRQDVTGIFLSSELSETDLLSLISETSEFFAEKYLFVHRHGLIEWMQSVFCPIGRNAANCVQCRNESMFNLQMTFDSEDKQNYAQPMLFQICHNESCSSQILGPKKNILGPETMIEISKLNIRIINVIRILNESDYEVDEIISGIMSQEK